MHPTPITRGGSEKRAEVLLDRQVALLIVGNKVVRTIAVSTGKPSTPTPPGSYRVYAKIRRWWSTPFREWLPWALPFVGGIASTSTCSSPATRLPTAAFASPWRLHAGRTRSRLSGCRSR
jgi:L,D-transpeptidase catalytic domain